MDRNQWLAYFILSFGLLTIGAIGGYFIKKDIGLVLICLIDSFLVGLLIYMFFLSYTGIWYWIPIITLALIINFAWLLRQKEARVQIEIQTSAVAGAYMVMKGIAMLTGGYNSEGQLF